MKKFTKFGLALVGLSLWLFLAMVPTADAGGVDNRDIAARSEIMRVIGDAEAAWQAGDLERFLNFYDPAATTTYLTGKGVLRGIEAIRAMYRDDYGLGTGGKAGRLALEILEFRMLDPGHVYIAAGYRLVLPSGEGGEVTGFASLVFAKTSHGWRVIADHAV